MQRFEYTRKGYQQAQEFLITEGIADRAKAMGIEDDEEYYPLIDFANDYNEVNLCYIIDSTYTREEIKHKLGIYKIVAGTTVLIFLAVMEIMGVI